MAEFLNKLDQGFLTRERRVVMASAVAWLLLLIVNAYHSAEEELKEDNELLKPVSINWKTKLYLSE